jgi:hypothetical protein
MFVYLVVKGVAYEGEDVIGVFSDYVKARECELKYADEYGYTEIRKVEVDKVYDDVFGGIGERV